MNNDTEAKLSAAEIRRPLATIAGTMIPQDAPSRARADDSASWPISRSRWARGPSLVRKALTAIAAKSGAPSRHDRDRREALINDLSRKRRRAGPHARAGDPGAYLSR